jgi:hypothetical protein
MATHKYFADFIQARQFLVSRIIEEARRQHEDLSDFEMKMLRTSDASSPLPDLEPIAVQCEDEAAIERYVEKIRRLSKLAYRSDRRNSPQDIARWKEAIAILKWHDPNLASMVELPRPIGDLVWLIVTALFTIIAGLCLVLAKAWLEETLPHETRDNFLAISIALFVVGACVLKYTQLGKTMRDWFETVADRVIDRFQ